MADKEKAEAEKALGNEALKANDFPKAIEHYTKAIDADPSNHVYYSNRAAAYTNCGLLDQAVSDADKAIEIKPDWARGYSRKGAALSRQQKIMEALECYQSGLEKCPNDKGLLQALQTVQQQAMQAQRQQMELFETLFGGSQMDKIAEHPKLKEFQKDPEFQKAVNEIGNKPASFAKYGNTAFGQRMIEVAVEMMQSGFGGAGAASPPPASASSESEGSSSSSPSASSSTSAAPAKEEPKKKEEEEVVEELSEERKQALAAKEEGNGLYKQRKFDEAIACYDKAIELDPTDMTFLTNRAAAKYEDARYDECIEDCEKAIEVGRQNRAAFALISKAFCRIGKAYTKQEKLGEAIEAYERAQQESKSRETAKIIRQLTAEKNKRDREAYLSPEKALEAKERGNKHFTEKRFKEAIEEYTEAIKRDPTNHVYYSNRATAYTKVMAWPQCLADCEKCIEIKPDFAKIYARKGNAHLIMKQNDKALEAFREGMRLDPANGEMKQGYERTMMAIQQARMSGQVDEEARARALADPEIQAVLREPEVQSALQELQRDPRALGRVMQNPALATKFEKLLAAGVV